MFKKQLKIGFIFFAVLFFAVLSGLTAQAVAAGTVEVGEVRTLGNKVEVPVIIRNTPYLTSGQMDIMVAPGSKGVTLKSFEAGPLFKGTPFKTTERFVGNKLTLDFIGTEQRLNNQPIVVGYITYALSDSFTTGTSASLDVTNIVAKGRNGADILFETLSGKIEHKMPIGDVTGNNRVDASGAMRILQHIKGDTITNSEALLSADVDGDGVLTSDDAQQILDYATGKRTSFLAIEARELDNGVLQSDYSVTIKAKHGREPYQYKRSGTWPAGLVLNEATGEISGIPRTARDYTFTIEVTDGSGNKANRAFTMKVIDSNITKVEQIESINVKQDEKPVLPSEVAVTYKDKSTGKEKVTWPDIDTSKLGPVTVTGRVGDSGFTINVIVHVIDENYIKNIDVKYVQFMELHTIKIDVHRDVAIVRINDINMSLEENNQFTLITPSLKSNSYVTIRLYDKYGNLLETKSHKLTPN